jgi:hypothetical protein
MYVLFKVVVVVVDLHLLLLSLLLLLLLNLKRQQTMVNMSHYFFDASMRSFSVDGS